MVLKLFKKLFQNKKNKKNVFKSKIKKSKKAKPAKKKTVKKKQPKKIKEKEIGVVTHYFGKIKVGIIKLKSSLKVGDTIQIKGAHVDFSQIIKSMQINHQNVSVAKKNDEIGIKVKKKVHPNDKVYKK